MEEKRIYFPTVLMIILIDLINQNLHSPKIESLITHFDDIFFRQDQSSLDVKGALRIGQGSSDFTATKRSDSVFIFMYINQLRRLSCSCKEYSTVLI